MEVTLGEMRRKGKERGRLTAGEERKANSND